MFKYRFECRSPERSCETVNLYITRDFPDGKNIFGKPLYKAGIHFTECDEEVKGFFIDHSESEHDGIHRARGSPIRVCFCGHFTEEDGKTYFDVYIYPKIPEALFILGATASIALAGEMTGTVVAIVVLLLFGRGYYKMMVETYEILKGIFN